MIQFKKEALRKYIFLQDFQMMGFMSCASMGGSTMQLIMYAPIILHGYLVAGKVIEEHCKPEHSIPLTSFWKLLAVPPITTLLNYGNNNRTELIKLRADLEVYSGFYLIFGWFFGMANLINIMLYWQCLRVRAMLNDNTKKAFSRVDGMLNQHVYQRLPSFAKKGYDFVRNFMVSMGSPPQPAAEQMNNPQLSSMMASAFRRCSIF